MDVYSYGPSTLIAFFLQIWKMCFDYGFFTYYLNEKKKKKKTL